MITAEQARSVAERAVESGPPAFGEWPEGAVGRPVVVHDTAGRASYWLVPYVVKDRAVGFVRVLGDGQVQALGTFGGARRSLERYPRTVTGLDAQEAIDRARQDVPLTAGETLTEPLFVHDGPPGREVWRVETRAEGRPSRWVFVSTGGCYVRPAGQDRPGSLEGGGPGPSAPEARSE